LLKKSKLHILFSIGCFLSSLCPMGSAEGRILKLSLIWWNLDSVKDKRKSLGWKGQSRLKDKGNRNSEKGIITTCKLSRRMWNFSWSSINGRTSWIEKCQGSQRRMQTGIGVDKDSIYFFLGFFFSHFYLFIYLFILFSPFFTFTYMCIHCLYFWEEPVPPSSSPIMLKRKQKR
jgi:hypothetical protein